MGHPSPARCAEQLLELEPDAQADLVLHLEVQLAGLVLRTLNGLETREGWRWSAAQAEHYRSARYLLMIWTGLYDHALGLGAQDREPAVARVAQARATRAP